MANINSHVLLSNIAKLDDLDIYNRIQNLNSSNPKTVTDNIDFNLLKKHTESYSNIRKFF